MSESNELEFQNLVMPDVVREFHTEDKAKHYKIPPTLNDKDDVYDMFRSGMTSHEISEVTGYVAEEQHKNHREQKTISKGYTPIQVIDILRDIFNEKNLNPQQEWDTWATMALSSSLSKMRLAQNAFISGIGDKNDLKASMDSLKIESDKIKELASSLGKDFNSKKEAKKANTIKTNISFVARS